VKNFSGKKKRRGSHVFVGITNWVMGKEDPQGSELRQQRLTHAKNDGRLPNKTRAGKGGEVRAKE